MMYDQGDIVVVPFPFSDLPVKKWRPAVVVSSHAQFNRHVNQSVVAMVTRAKLSDWPLDVTLKHYAEAGLATPGKIRLKLFTIDHQLVKQKVGTLKPEDQHAVETALKTLLGLT